MPVTAVRGTDPVRENNVATPLTPGGPTAYFPGGGLNPANPPAPPPPPTPPPSTGPNPASLLYELRAAFPWLDQIGLTAEFFQELVAGAASEAEIITKIRATSQYRARFAGLWRSDGSMRMNEAQYLDRENDFRQLILQYGLQDRIDIDNPSSFVGLFDSEQDPNELRQRLDVWRNITTAGQAQRDAFYVYAGLRVSNDDLFAAVVDPAAAQRLSEEYRQRVAASPFDYTTWITRATEVGLSRVAETLTTLQRNGAVTSTAVQAILGVDPNFARTIMDAIYTGGGGTVTGTLNLQELLSSFEYAAIGSAATQAGLALPTRERIAEIRAAGVDRARALTAYGQFGATGNLYDSLVRRAGRGSFGQADFEDAAFLGDSGDQARLAAGIARENAAGERQGGFQFQQNRRGRFTQQGFR